MFSGVSVTFTYTVHSPVVPTVAYLPGSLTVMIVFALSRSLPTPMFRHLLSTPLKMMSELAFSVIVSLLFMVISYSTLRSPVSGSMLKADSLTPSIQASSLSAPSNTNFTS